jgi:N-acetylmuramoyl-L-alanine amidase
VGEVIPAPGSDSRIFAPNPAALVVAIDPGHGGCLDWGVPNPHDNHEANAEKALTLGIGLRLRDLLEADGVTVVMTRETDVALAGDLYPDLGCAGEPFRDVNGDGLAGFGPEYPEGTRTRDELAARLDLVNLARADLLISIHINSMTENGVVYEIAATQTFYTDERPWGATSESLAGAVQDAVVQGLSSTGYERQDRGTSAVNYYVLAPPAADGDVHQPTRGSLMPGVLTEVGSMSLAAESELLASSDGQDTIAQSLFEAVAEWVAARPIGVRMDALIAGGTAGIPSEPIGESGPPYWPASLPATVGETSELTLRLTNTGASAWPDGLSLVVGWSTTEAPYLDAAPATLEDLVAAVPALAPGESVELAIQLVTPPADGRQVGWISLRDGTGPWSEHGLPALQLGLE